MTLPAEALRTNVATWAVSDRALPAVTHAMLSSLPAEPYDPDFQGQPLATAYFDTLNFDLRKARARRDQYLTLRLRSYGDAVFALSAKTEAEKFRREITPQEADFLLACSMPPTFWSPYLPANLLARLQDLAGDQPLTSVVTVLARRYAVENASDRLTLDVGVKTDTGKRLACHVLEHKSVDHAFGPIIDPTLRPIKLSKFLWATQWR
jgi:hypothetical protein